MGGLVQGRGRATGRPGRAVALAVVAAAALLAIACTDDRLAARRRAAGPHPTIEALMRVADAGRGQRLFRQCAGCHSIRAGAPDHYGPNLSGVMTKAIGHASDTFAYTGALRQHGGRWTPAAMSAWLENPQRFAPGTQMQFSGVADPLDRADLIAYLAAPPAP